MSKFAKKALFAVLLAGVAGPALAADPYYPPAEPAPPQVVYEDESYGGWYIRGDLDYHWTSLRGINYVLYNEPGSSNSFDYGDIDGAGSLGLGVGYQINNHLRADLTGDYWFKGDFNGQTTGWCDGIGVCSSSDKTKFSALLLMANAYVDIGTWHGFTPYVGAGIGGAHVKWDDLANTIGTTTTYHKGGKNWRFAYALMAGASYCLTDNLKLDAGYRYVNFEGGEMFGYNMGGGPGYDDGGYSHEVRGGLRYQFGKSNCAGPEPIAYEPAPEPIYTK